MRKCKAIFGKHIYIRVNMDVTCHRIIKSLSGKQENIHLLS